MIGLKNTTSYCRFKKQINVEMKLYVSCSFLNIFKVEKMFRYIKDAICVHSVEVNVNKIFAEHLSKLLGGWVKLENSIKLSGSSACTVNKR